jgi:hypothetical protein
MGEYQQPARWCHWAWQFLVSSTTPSHVQPHLARIPALTGAVRGSPADDGSDQVRPQRPWYRWQVVVRIASKKWSLSSASPDQNL